MRGIGMIVKAYTINDPDYKGRDALVFCEIDGCFYPIYCHESAMGVEGIIQDSTLGFFYVNIKFYRRFASKITDELNKRGKEQIEPILEEVFG